VRKIKQFLELLGYKLKESGDFAARLYTKYSRYLFYNIVRILVSKLSQSCSTEYMGTSTYSIISAKGQVKNQLLRQLSVQLQTVNSDLPQPRDQC